MSKPALPAWAAHAADQQRGADVVEADPALFYPAILAELGVAEPTQYWLEVAYQIMKMDLQKAMGRFDFVIHMLNRPAWAHAQYPGAPADVARATKGQEAREHYRRLRGALPA